MRRQGKGKLARVVPAVVKAERKEANLPHQAPWLDDFVTELASLVGANDLTDDQVDALACPFGQPHGCYLARQECGCPDRHDIGAAAHFAGILEQGRIRGGGAVPSQAWPTRGASVCHPHARLVVGHAKG